MVFYSFFYILLFFTSFSVQAFQGPGASRSRFFRVQVFLGPAFSGFRFFRVRSRVRVQVSEVAVLEKLFFRTAFLTYLFLTFVSLNTFISLNKFVSYRDSHTK